MSVFIGGAKGPSPNSVPDVADVWCSRAGVELRLFNTSEDWGKSERDGVQRTFDPVAARNLAALLVRASDEAERMRVRELPEEVDLDGHVDARGITYLGKALRQPDGLYVCLADVDGCLCRVEVKITPKEGSE